MAGSPGPPKLNPRRSGRVAPRSPCCALAATALAASPPDPLAGGCFGWGDQPTASGGPPPSDLDLTGPVDRAVAEHRCRWWAAISAAATGLALRVGPGARGLPTGRQTERQAQRQSGRPTGQAPEPHQEIWPESASPAKGQSTAPFQAGPSRAPGDPAPTVAVPFRVIRKAQTTSASAPPPPHAAEAKATAVGDGWDQTSSDDW